jgi:hypothetical protein
MGGAEDYVRRRWWSFAGAAVFLLAGLLLVVSPARPLWPAVAVLRALGAEHSTRLLGRRAWTVYSVYRSRSDAFAPARALLPPDADPLGVITSDHPETSLWRPFGHRRILHVCHGDTPEETRQRGINYVLVSSTELSNRFRVSIDQWLVQNDGQLLQRLSLDLRASQGPVDWFLVKLR